MSRLYIGLAVLVPFIGATTTAAPIPRKPKEPPLYFPTRVGAKWVYQIGEKDELTLSVTAVEKTDAGLLVSVTKHRPGGKTFLDKKMLVAPTGVTQVEGFDGKLESPWCWLKIPCVVGEKWESDCSNDLFVQKWECTVLGTEEVEVPAGKFTAVKVSSKLVAARRDRGPFPNIDISQVEWYAPGVGVVKVEPNRPARPQVLKSFIP